MKWKIYLTMLILGTFIVLGGMGMVSGVGCGVTPTDLCTVATDTTFDTATYNLNGSSSGAIQITGSNLFLNCNNSIILGNSSTVTVGLGVGAKENITILNCNFKEYNKHILTTSTSRNITIRDNTFGNSTAQSIHFANTNNNLITNNTFISTYPFSNESAGKVLMDSNSINITIENNSFTNNNPISPISIRINTATSSNINIISNNFTGVGNLTLLSTALRIDVAHNYTYFRNNFVNQMLGVRILDGANHVIIDNNLFNYSYAALRTGNTTNVTISSNRFINSKIAYLGTTNTNVTSVTIINNSVYNTTAEGAASDLHPIVFLYYDLNNINIINNTFYNSTGSGGIAPNFIRADTFKIDGLTISGNTFNITSLHIDFLAGRSGRNIIIRDNVFGESLGNYDSYSNGILLTAVNQANITNNIFYSSCNPIEIQNASNIIINNNNFNLNKNFLINNKVNCAYEPFAAIGIQELWKTHTPISGGAESISYTSTWKSINITLNNNTFNGYDVLLRTQGVVNLNHDLSNYWYRSFQTPTYLLDREEWFISNSVNNVSTIFNASNNNPVVSRNILGNGFRGSTNQIRMQFTIFKSPAYSYFTNVNASNNFATIVFNLTSPRIYNASLTSGTIITNSQSNLTLAPTKEVYISDASWT